jgi:hypothetical protein
MFTLLRIIKFSNRDIYINYYKTFLLDTTIMELIKKHALQDLNVLK